MKGRIALCRFGQLAGHGGVWSRSACFAPLWISQADSSAQYLTGGRKAEQLKLFLPLVCCLLISACTKVVTVGAPAPPVPPSPPVFSDTIQRIKRAIIPMVCAVRDGNRATNLSVEGTGFFVKGDGTFVTADHVIAGMIATNRRTPCPLTAFYLPQAGNWSAIRERPTFETDYYFFNTQDCIRDAVLDLARCRSLRDVASGHDVASVIFKTDFLDDGELIAFTGFPLQFQVPISSIADVAGYSDAANDNLGPRTIVIDTIAWPGASGSPIYTIDGKVVGMVRARGTGDGEGLSYGRPARFIQQFLTETQ